MQIHQIFVNVSKGQLAKKDDLISWQYRLLNHRDKKVKASQLALLKKYEIPFDEKRLHDAIYDCEMTYKIFKKQLFEIEL